MDKYYLVKKGYIYEYYHYSAAGLVEQVSLFYTNLPTFDQVTGLKPERSRVLIQASYSRSFVNPIGLPVATEISKEQYEEALGKVNPVDKPDVPMLPGLQSITAARVHQLKKYPTSNDIGREVELLRAAICCTITAIHNYIDLDDAIEAIDRDYYNATLPGWFIAGSNVEDLISKAGALLAAVIDVLKEKEDIRKAGYNAVAKQTKACCTIFPEAVKTNCHE